MLREKGSITDKINSIASPKQLNHLKENYENVLLTNHKNYSKIVKSSILIVKYLQYLAP